VRGVIIPLGSVGGYTGPGGKTILPHRAVAKIDMRLAP
jgi:acetylornithine deacetylase/succinyl-diaminopimelate desuccinylase-like protein